MERKTLAYISYSPSEYSNRVALGIARYISNHPELSLQILGRQGFVPLWDVKGFDGDGVIGMFSSLEEVKHYHEQGIPVINISSSTDEIKPRVVVDNYQIGVLAAKYFLQRSYENVAFLTLPDDALYSQLRRQGFLETFAKTSIVPHEIKLSSMINYSAENWFAGIEELYLQIRDLPKPLAIFCSLDIIARLLSQACEKYTIKIPSEVAIMGVDNDELICSSCRVSLTSIEQGEDRVGYLAAQTLHDLLRGKEVDQEIVIPAIGIVTRQSTDASAMADDAISSALSYMRKNFKDISLGMKDIINESGLSRTLFERRFKKSVGRSPARELLEMRVEQARQLLIATEDSLEDIAEACGFRRRERLQEAFKRLVKYSPAEYRKLFKN